TKRARSPARPLRKCAEERLRAEDPQRLAPAFGRRPVENQDPVEVVELVLNHTRIALLQLQADVLTVLVLALDRHLDRPLDWNRHALHRAAAFGVPDGPLSGGGE